MLRMRYSSTWFALTAALAAVGCDRAPDAWTASVEASRVPHSSQSSTLGASPAAFVDDYQAALARSQAEGRPLLLFFQADWCLHCRRMNETVFTEASVRELAEKFICVRIDTGKHSELCEQFHVSAYPTIVFASPSGMPMQRLIGAQSPQVVVQEMALALTAVAERQTQPTTVRR